MKSIFTTEKRDIAPFIRTNVSNVKVEPGINGPVGRASG